MPKAKLKTTVNNASVSAFIDSLTDEQQKEDSKKIDEIMQTLSGEKPKMWGKSLIGYGKVHLTYASGRNLDCFKVGFSPRKQNFSLYICSGGMERFTDLLEKLGKHSTGMGCLYIKRLGDVDTEILKKIIQRSIDL
jgi:hypothetical protein